MSNAELITRLKRASWPGDLFDQAAQEIERLQSLVFSASLDGFETTNGVANDGAYRGDTEMSNADLIASFDVIDEFLDDAAHFELADGSTVDITAVGAAVSLIRAAIEGLPEGTQNEQQRRPDTPPLREGKGGAGRKGMASLVRVAPG